MTEERWIGDTAEVVFTTSTEGIVYVERDALALLLVAAGFERVTP